MKTTNVTVGNLNPTATLAINKGRVKMYNKKSAIPTYYLQKGQEFQIEIFNPTTHKILAKIKLNNNLISQSGLVLRPGERIFLDRFFDIDKKFKFDTYEVSGGDEVKQAIKENGDVEILFYREERILDNLNILRSSGNVYHRGPFTAQPWTFYSDGTSSGGYASTTTTNASDITFSTTNISNSSNTIAGATLDSLSFDPSVVRGITSKYPSDKKLKSRSLSKKIETGRVEEGTKSNQKFQTVNLRFESYAFHTVYYKLLPNSQKNVESQDLHKSYCTNCGAKAKAKDNFCSKCGRKI